MTEEKRTRGWYGQRVAELSDEFIILQQDFEQLKKDANYQELTRLAGHPLFERFDNFYDRFRRMEQSIEALLSKVNSFDSRIAGVESAVRSLTAPRGRGA